MRALCRPPVHTRAIAGTSEAIRHPLLVIGAVVGGAGLSRLSWEALPMGIRLEAGHRSAEYFYVHSLPDVADRHSRSGAGIPGGSTFPLPLLPLSGSCDPRPGGPGEWAITPALPLFEGIR